MKQNAVPFIQIQKQKQLFIAQKLIVCMDQSIVRL